MKITKTKFSELKIFEGSKFDDKRGTFRELIIQKKIKSKIIFTVFSKSKKNVLRGLHMQRKFPQGKYVSVIKGSILDVVVDCRKNSKTFGKHFKIFLSDKDNRSLLIPAGFAHGFYTLTDGVVIHYKCSNYRHANSETGIIWNDKDLKIKWPIKKPIVSKKDKKNLSFKDYVKKFIK